MGPGWRQRAHRHRRGLAQRQAADAGAARPGPGRRARLDLGRTQDRFHDVSKYGWGELRLESRQGDILQAPGSLIDLSASHNRAGSLTAIALDPLAGRVDLLGAIQGQASGRYDAGGTLVPYAAGGVDIRAQRLDFAALNQRLNAGGVFGSRSFQIKQGDLTVGDEVRARQVSISLDGGRLTMAGRIDASGEGVGSIRLAAAQGLRIAAGAAGRAQRAAPGQLRPADRRAEPGAHRTQFRRRSPAVGRGRQLRPARGVEAPGGALGLGSMELNAPRLGPDRGRHRYRCQRRLSSVAPEAWPSTAWPSIAMRAPRRIR